MYAEADAPVQSQAVAVPPAQFQAAASTPAQSQAQSHDGKDPVPRTALQQFNKVLGEPHIGAQLIITERQKTLDVTWRVNISAFRLSFLATMAPGAASFDNPLYSPQLAEYMRATCFKRFPLWSRLALGNRMQVSNATTEVGARILK